MTYDIESLARSLDASPDGKIADLSWIDRSTREPEPFWADLGEAFAASLRPRPKSVPGERYDLYHDMVIRHLAEPGRPALRWYERARGFQALSYGDLHARAGRKAGAWAAQKVETGDVLAVVLHPGPAWLVAVLAALRMGLVVAWLPPLGDRFVARRIDALGPKHIASDEAYSSLLVGYEKLVLKDGIDAPAYPDIAHTYAPGKPCAWVLSPLHDPPAKPRKLMADAAFCAAARDGMLAHRLGPGDLLAAPGFHPLQHQPALAFTALLAGATWLEVPEADVVADPKLLTEFPLRSLGVTAPVRDALLASSPGKLSRVDHWFRNIEEPFDSEAFRIFKDELGLAKTPASSLLVDPTAGGCALQSVRRRGADWRVVPAPGQPYALADLVTGKDAIGDHGVFDFAARPGEKPAKDGHALVGKNGQELAYGGTTAPRREGRVYPADEVTEVVSMLPFCEGAFVIPIAAGGVLARHLFTLCVFTGTNAPEGRADAIERAILSRLGRDSLPDRVETFPLYPRLSKGKIDLAWCESQHRTGLLARKAEDPMFQALTALRGRCAWEARS